MKNQLTFWHMTFEMRRAALQWRHTHSQEDAIFNMNMIHLLLPPPPATYFRVEFHRKCKLIIIPKVSTFCWVWFLHKLWHHQREETLLSLLREEYTQTHCIYHRLYNYINIWGRLYAEVTVHMCLSCFCLYREEKEKISWSAHIMRETLDIYIYK